MTPVNRSGCYDTDRERERHGEEGRERRERQVKRTINTDNRIITVMRVAPQDGRLISQKDYWFISAFSMRPFGGPLDQELCVPQLFAADGDGVAATADDGAEGLATIVADTAAAVGVAMATVPEAPPAVPTGGCWLSACPATLLATGAAATVVNGTAVGALP